MTPSGNPRQPHDERAFLLAGAQWQDTLLQSYRMLHVTIQGFLVTAGAAVLAVQLTSAIQRNDSHPFQVAAFSLLFTALLGALYLLQWRTAADFAGVVHNRAEDVNHWHRLVILSENGFLPANRSFTLFKHWQRLQRGNLEDVERYLVANVTISREEANSLIQKGIGHTRDVIDHILFARLRRLWYALLATSTGITLWFCCLAAIGPQPH